MDELTKALAEAIKAGSVAAGPALHTYFMFRIADDAISYILPCSCIIIVAWIVTATIRYCYDKELEVEKVQRS
jgi:hypothetical protein